MALSTRRLARLHDSSRLVSNKLHHRKAVPTPRCLATSCTPNGTRWVEFSCTTPVQHSPPPFTQPPFFWKIPSIFAPHLLPSLVGCWDRNSFFSMKPEPSSQTNTSKQLQLQACWSITACAHKQQTLGSARKGAKTWGKKSRTNRSFLLLCPPRSSASRQQCSAQHAFFQAACPASRERFRQQHSPSGAEQCLPTFLMNLLN